MHPSHLQRLDRIWTRQALFFITTATQDRRPLLARHEIFSVLQEEWRSMHARHGWSIGRYLVMPDHVHFFALASASTAPLERMVGRWKEWTAKRCLPLVGLPAPFWQKRFFDHLLRSHESFVEKWDYVRMNPVRAKLVARPEDWPF